MFSFESNYDVFSSIKTNEMFEGSSLVNLRLVELVALEVWFSSVP